MGLSQDAMEPFEQIVRFSGERVDTRGYIDLDKFGEGNECCKTIRIRYLLVDAKTSLKGGLASIGWET